ncbi:tetratricopeptide repeat protein [Sediminibacterium sp.]|uniref:tetratricopeptide repeat protein n=1 Tax=Sediminibacterium sp. TaxID=1917865 RepID=UPI002732D293|nr:tetratricopeptide repeat protein [Sediminibacterium sp.]MDP3147087.1 tetratricopeptide repeat protein [Bacteroidota bacterium]MDP3567381.1 tetratricopeptide repeat protein [Sediminibacterium sp.]
MEFNKIGDYKSGLLYGNRAVVTAKKFKIPMQEAQALNNIGIIYYNGGKYPEALHNYFNGYKIASLINDKEEQSILLSNIGAVYDEQAKYDKAMEYYLKSQQIAFEQKNKELVASNYNNIGSVYLKRNDLKTALDYFLKGLKIKQELGNKYGASNALLNIGALYYNMGDYAKTLKYFMGAYKYKEDLNDKAGVAVVLGNIGAVYMEIGEYSRAEDFLIRSLKKSEEINSLDDRSNAHLNLSELFKTTKKFEEALFHFTAYKNLEDSLSNDSKSKDIGRLEAKHEFDIKQAVFDAEHKKEIELGAEREKRQKFVSYFIAGGLLLVLLFAIFIYNRFKITNKQKIIIEHQKIIVEHKQKETMDSIRYAQRIQESILPSEKYIKNTFDRLKKE